MGFIFTLVLLVASNVASYVFHDKLVAVVTKVQSKL